MADPVKNVESTWDERSVQWAQRAPKAESNNDGPNQLLIRLAGIEPGDNVLDMASGTGEPAISIALKVGATGRVMATDATLGMLEAAEKRAKALGLKNIEFHVCPMEKIPFEADRFDAVTCRFGLMHAEDAVAGLKNALRILRAGGKAACLVHGAPEKNTAYSVIRSTLFEYLKIDDPEFGKRRFRFSKQGELTDLYREAGFTDINEEEFSNTISRDKGDRFWEAQIQQGFGPLTKHLSNSQLSDLSRRMETAFEPHISGDQYQLVSTERGVWGSTPD